MVARIPFPGRASILGAALCLAACNGPGTAGAAGRKARTSSDEPVVAAPSAAPPPIVPPVSAPASVAAPPLAGPIPGAKTSDRGDRMARPAPIGQLAPEEAPATPPAPGGAATKPPPAPAPR